MIKPLVSIVMPAYNVEKYITVALNSILLQTFQNWELIIVNDCSTDNTLAIINNYNDDRIRVINRMENSGAAYIPRSQAVDLVEGDWILCIDADDFIEKTYIERLVNEAQAYNTDICLPQMVVVEEIGIETGYRVPSDEQLFSRVLTGREAFGYTLPEWKIGMNGSMIKKDIWIRALNQYKRDGKRGVHDDEILSRLCLLEAERVKVCKIKYNIRINPSSVTNTVSLKSFDWEGTISDLLQIVEDKCGMDSIEYKNTLLYDFLCYKLLFSEFFKKVSDENTFIKGYKLLKKWNDRIEWQNISGRYETLRQKVFSKFLLASACCFIKKPRFIIIKAFFYLFLEKIKGIFVFNKYFAWYVTRRIREKKRRRDLEHYYCAESTGGTYHRGVVCIYDGALQAGGLADRLKGIIGVYSIAKEKGIPFYLYFNNPFPLEDYLEPNTYDWSIDKNAISLVKDNVEIVILDNTQDSTYQQRKQRAYLDKHIIESTKQIHVYTNSSFSYGLDYEKLFNELFKPSKKLEKAIEREKEQIGQEYISISCRFLDLLGDFNETYGYGEELSETEKDLLLRKIDEAILKLHAEYKDKMILVNSDSVSFLKRYMDKEFTYVVSGNVTHIDAKQGEYSYEQYEKTFLDFMMIADAEKIFLIKSKEMHNSGYPYAASRVYGRSYEIIEI